MYGRLMFCHVYNSQMEMRETCATCLDRRKGDEEGIGSCGAITHWLHRGKEGAWRRESDEVTCFAWIHVGSVQ